MNIRIATVRDSAALLNIYAQYINTPVTFETTLPTAADFAGRIAQTLCDYPYLVCEENGQIVGYAYAHRQKERAAYGWNAELSIYLDAAHISKGIGRQLYCLLMELLVQQGIKTAYGCVTMPNEKSERLHLGLGFTRIGTFPSTGYKCGRWHDVAWFSKPLAPYDELPAEITPFSQLSPQAVRQILQRYSGAR